MGRFPSAVHYGRKNCWGLLNAQAFQPASIGVFRIEWFW
jgi:hypothetical protein